ncbi:MAG TPA: endonuclease III domain-containing protein [Phycisphaerae bacterium]|nr:endonuclease III domain-containing protein [Phycisphaerae bacterium]HRW54996.1 endonuclease III domain-containing protein [Phycisphaerae bacterium]
MPQHDSTLQDFYDRLFERFGPQHWWPGESDVEIVVGAILTQNTSWTNVEYAIDNLKRDQLLDWRSLRDIDDTALAERIRPAGYYNLKTRRLRNFVNWLWTRHDGDLAPLRRAPLADARAQLLGVNGIGPETADSILLYALEHPIFVIDAYTGRLLRRHGLVNEKATYGEMQAMFHDRLPHDVATFNEYHALIVRLAREHCRVRAECAKCPLAHHAHNEHLR